MLGVAGGEVDCVCAGGFCGVGVGVLLIYQFVSLGGEMTTERRFFDEGVLAPPPSIPIPSPRGEKMGTEGWGRGKVMH